MNSAKVLVLVSCALLGTSCVHERNFSPAPSIPPDAKVGLERPVDCDNANKDLLTLEEQRITVSKQIMAGARAVIPVSAAAGILTGDYSDRVQVASGSYNDALVAKMDQIKHQCGVY